jgi:hypothetical protein
MGPADANGKADVDMYLVTVPTAGTLAAHLSAVDDADLVLEIADQNNQVLVSSDNGPAKTAEGVPNLFVQPGNYSVTVREFVKKPKSGKPAPRTQPSQPYALDVELGPIPAPDEEREPNDDAAFSDDLVLGGDVTGWIGWKHDKDYWKLPLDHVPEDDALSVDVDAVPDVTLSAAVQDGTGAVLLERKGREGEGLALRNVAVKKGEPFYFVVVSGDRPNIDEKYTLKVTSTPFQVDEEAEPNDSPQTASPLADVPNADAGTRVGFLAAGDVDFYKLDPAATPRLLHLVVEPPGAIGAEIAVVGDDGKPVPGGGPVDPGKKGAPARLDDVAIGANMTAYVRVTNKSGSTTTDRYRLRWSAVAVTAPEPTPIPGME